MQQPQVTRRARVSPPEQHDTPRMRERYDSALALITPLLDSPAALNGTGLYRVMSQLQTRYPDLTASEIEALVASVVRASMSQANKRSA